MHVDHLNRSPNKGVMVSKINKRKGGKRGLQFHLSEGGLSLGKDLRQGEAEIGQFWASGLRRRARPSPRRRA